MPVNNTLLSLTSGILNRLYVIDPVFHVHDRGQFYVEQYALTQSAGALLEGHISTFSGTAGGIGFAANYLLGDYGSNPNSVMPYSLGQIFQLSENVAEGFGMAVEAEINREGDGNLTINQGISAADNTWRNYNLYLERYFPGNSSVDIYFGNKSTPINLFDVLHFGVIQDIAGVSASGRLVNAANCASFLFGKELSDFKGLDGNFLEGYILGTVHNPDPLVGDLHYVVKSNGDTNGDGTVDFNDGIVVVIAQRRWDYVDDYVPVGDLLESLLWPDNWRNIRQWDHLIEFRRQLFEGSGNTLDFEAFFKEHYEGSAGNFWGELERQFDPHAYIRNGFYLYDRYKVGNDGADYLYGGRGNDTLQGLAGDDRLEGGWGIDELSGGSGNDHIEGGAGADKLTGGDGADVIYGGSTISEEMVIPITSDVSYEEVTVPSSIDLGDFIDGGSGDDELYGNDGNDVIVGGTGNDWLEGGSGNNELNGGTGSDTYIVDLKKDAIGGVHRDTIADSDGGGQVSFHDTATGASHIVSGTAAYDAANHYWTLNGAILTRQGADLNIKFDANNSATIKNFNNGDAYGAPWLGIKLGAPPNEKFDPTDDSSPPMRDPQDTQTYNTVWAKISFQFQVIHVDTVYTGDIQSIIYSKLGALIKIIEPPQSITLANIYAAKFFVHGQSLPGDVFPEFESGMTYFTVNFISTKFNTGYSSDIDGLAPFGTGVIGEGNVVWDTVDDTTDSLDPAHAGHITSADFLIDTYRIVDMVTEFSLVPFQKGDVQTSTFGPTQYGTYWFPMFAPMQITDANHNGYDDFGQHDQPQGNQGPSLSTSQGELPSAASNHASTVSSSALLQGLSDPNGDTLSVVGLFADHGTAVENADGSFTIIPEPGYTGVVSLHYGVSDGVGGLISAHQSFVIPNGAPVLNVQPVVQNAVQEHALRLSTSALLFGFSDPDNQSLTVTGLSADHGIVVDNLDETFSITPTSGYFGPLTISYSATDSGGASTAVSVHLNVFQVLADGTIIGTAQPDDISGTVGDDKISGLTGDDHLDGKLGVDVMSGGLGNDTYVIDNPGDTVTELAGQGTDTVWSSVSYSVATVYVENLTLTGSGNIDAVGNGLTNILTGNMANNRLDGSISADTMIGGKGDDTYIVDSAGDVVTELSGEGMDTVQSSISYTLGANVENLMLTGPGTTGIGNGLGNVLTSSVTIDTLAGGLGDDTYVVNNSSDVVIEGATAGTDTVMSSVTYSIATVYAENITLTGSLSISATGNGMNNILTGNSGNNILNGSVGADTMIGGAGGDYYYVDNAGDTVVEYAAGGTDMVYALVSYSLGANVENVTLLGSGNFDASGNELNNFVIGNAGNNTLNAGAGADYIFAQSGNDLVDGGIGADGMYGGSGNDTYMVDNFADLCNEQSTGTGIDDGGTDIVISSANFQLSAFIENLTMNGTAVVGAGNASNNIILGNASGNYLFGLDGTDTLNGGAGGDAFYGGSGADTFMFSTGSGFDVIGDFSAAEGDTIDLHAYSNGVTNGAGIAVTQSGGGTYVNMGGGNVIFVANATADNVSSHIIW